MKCGAGKKFGKAARVEIVLKIFNKCWTMGGKLWYHIFEE